MGNKIFKCVACGKYTLEQVCCGQKTVGTKPAKFRVDDKYGDYRRRGRKRAVELV
ncbi:MAG: RNA-protein complex protein Nop10 [Nanoarchaeota archaeon]|nr:RNA-protein complex protein Nop10 [Nanoarchaeota archaeon]